MAIHVKNRWYNKDANHSITEIAGALAFTAWRLAKDRAMNLHKEGFIYEDDKQRMAVIAEYLYFQIHIIDRLTYANLEHPDRNKLIIQLAHKLAELVQDNGLDLFGAGEHDRWFLDELNQRSTEYGELGFGDDTGPSYPVLRHLGYSIQQIMAKQEENKWVIDQVMDRDGGELYQQIAKTLKGLTS